MKPAAKSSPLTPALIKKLRQRLALTQSQFAAKLGVSLRTVQGWESEDDGHRPSQLALVQLAKLDKNSRVI